MFHAFPVIFDNPVAPQWFQKGKADGVDPTLWADFVNNRYAVNGVAVPFADVLTHTRASTATYFDASGVMQFAAVNAPRFDYDPVTLLPKGLLLEEQRTNVLKYSKSPITHWFGIGATTSAAAGTMLGYFSGGITVASAGATWHRSRPDNISWTNAVVQSWSAFVRAGTSGKIRVSFNDTVAVTESSASGTLGAVLTVTATAAGAVTHDKTISLGGGYYILSGTFTPNSTMAGQGQFAVGPNSAVVGETIDLFGAQFEAGAFPTSFIETTTAAVTRSKDTCLNSAANVKTFASWYNTALTTLYSEYLCINRGVLNGVASISNNSNTDRIMIRSNAGQSAGVVAAEGAFGYLNSGLVVEPTSTFTKNTLAAELNNVIQYANATAGTLDTSCAMPVGVNRLIVGAGETTVTGIFSGHIKELRYYPIRVTNPELVRITT